MSTIEKLKRYLMNADYRFIINDGLGFYKKMADKPYLERKFKVKLGYPLNLDHPTTFNEKLQWLKLYDRNPEYTKLVDKYEVKPIVAEKIGQEHVIPTFSVWNRPEDIDFDSLPNQFVLKCTHDSGGLVVCRDKAKLDRAAAIQKLQDALKRDYYIVHREWPYKNVKPRIIAEKYMVDENQAKGLRDYKFYCFNGQVRFLYVSDGLEDHSTATISFLNLDWSFAPFRRLDFLPMEELPAKPKHFDEMVQVAQQLSAGIPFVRVDLYEIDGKMYFSEMTFSPCSGLTPFEPEDWDRKIGDMLRLPEYKMK